LCFCSNVIRSLGLRWLEVMFILSLLSQVLGKTLDRCLEVIVYADPLVQMRRSDPLPFGMTIICCLPSANRAWSDARFVHSAFKMQYRGNCYERFCDAFTSGQLLV
jgi:hypothetical protein